MRTLVVIFSAVAAIGSLRQIPAQEVEAKATTPKIEASGRPDRAELDRIIDRIIAREHYEYIYLSYFHPILETHIQDEKRHGNEEMPWRQWDLRGSTTIAADLSVHSILKKNPDIG